GDGGAFDRLERPEVAQERPLAGRADARNLLQAGFANVAFPALPVRADREAMRLVPQPLDEIEHRVSRLEQEGLAPAHEEGLAPGVALRTLGDGDKRQIAKPELLERLAGGVELAEPAVDQHQVRPS